MTLFEVEAGRRVRLTSKTIRWSEHSSVLAVADNLTWEGTTTDRYFFYKGARRRLLVDHTIEAWDEYGVWQRDTTCEIIG